MNKRNESFEEADKQMRKRTEHIDQEVNCVSVGTSRSSSKCSLM